MFDIGWSELFILVVVTLVFVGPKEMPVLFRALGRYAGMVRRQASEFRSHFEDAMREAEFDQINKEVMQVKEQVTSAVADAEKSARVGVDSVKDAAADATREPEAKSSADQTKDGA